MKKNLKLKISCQTPFNKRIFKLVRKKISIEKEKHEMTSFSFKRLQKISAS